MEVRPGLKETVVELKATGGLIGGWQANTKSTHKGIFLDKVLLHIAAGSTCWFPQQQEEHLVILGHQRRSLESLREGSCR